MCYQAIVIYPLSSPARTQINHKHYTLLKYTGMCMLATVIINITDVNWQSPIR